MLFKTGTTFEWDGEMFDYLIVADQDEADAALADGWSVGKPAKGEEAPAKRKPGRPAKTEGLSDA